MSENGEPSPSRAVPGRSFRGTPFHPATSAATGTPFWYAWDTNHVVDMYTDVDREVGASRRAGAIGDMSPLNTTLVKGPDSSLLFERVVSRDLGRLSVGARTVGRVTSVTWAPTLGIIYLA